MNVLDRLRKRTPRAEGGNRRSAKASAVQGDQLPIPGYDCLDDKQVGARLPELSQVELADVETYERSHRKRPAVLDKLRYMRGTQPLPGYDTLSPEQIAVALAGADAEAVKAVRDYERKFRRRGQVLEEAARVLPTSPSSAGEDRMRQAKAALVRDGFAGRAQTAGGLASRPTGQLTESGERP